MSEQIKTNGVIAGVSDKMTSAPVPPVAVPEAKAASVEQVLELLKDVAALKAKVEAKEPKREAAKPQEPIDWTKINETHVADLNFPIPVYEHELPDYMTVYLSDNNYVAKWVHRSAAHLGTMLASGYEYITASDWDPTKPRVLAFNPDGHLIYDDVIALKVHKSRYFGKLRREQLKSTQIRGISGYNKVKGMVGNAIANIPGMASAMEKGAMSFYGESAESAVEQISI